MEAMFQRKGKTIIDLSAPHDSPDREKTFKSINAAKKESRKIQIENGGLGCGYLTAS